MVGWGRERYPLSINSKQRGRRNQLHGGREDKKERAWRLAVEESYQRRKVPLRERKQRPGGKPRMGTLGAKPGGI